MNIKINATEVATRLAHRQLIMQFKGKGLKVYEDTIDEFVGTKYTEQAQAIFDVHYDYYWDRLAKNKIYPFKEGDTYWTIEDRRMIKSCWDNVSEELYDRDSSIELFRNEDDVIKRWKEIEALKLLKECHTLLVHVENEGMIDYHYTKEDISRMLNKIEHIQSKNNLIH